MQPSHLKTVFQGFLSLIAIFIFSLSPALAQMKQMYLDADEDNNIHKISFYSLNEGYVAFTNWIGYTTDSGSTYTKKFITASNVSYGSYTNINLTFGFGIEGAKAFDKNNLIVYGHYGLVPAILQSADGGTSYKLVFYSQYDPSKLRTGIKDVIFPENGSIGYAVDADRILKTTDKGQNWFVQVPQADAYFDHLEAVDNDHVIAISTDYNAKRLLKTSNGGTSWLWVTLPETGVMTYAYFLDANVGWLSVDNGQFYKTTNGGQQWTPQNDVDAAPFNCDKMRFTDVNTGYALVAPYKVYKTTNSGVTWEPLSRENNYSYLGYSHNDLQCLSATQLWAGGGHGNLEMSANGGGTPIPAAYFKTDTSGMSIAGTVKLLNFSKTGYQYKWLVNGSLINTSYNTSYTHDIVRSADTVQLIVFAGGVSDTLTKYPQFYAGGIPKVSSYYPKTGSAGTFVTIYGSKFSNVSGVSFAGTPAASFTVLSDTEMTAVVAGGATGTITLKQFYGIIPVGEFAYHAPLISAPPLIQTASPSAGIPGTTITISGRGFGTGTSQNNVFFGTVPAKLESASSGTIVCTVPAGASMGPIQVLNKNNGLSGESPFTFNVPFADSAANFTTNSFTEGLIVNKGSGIPKNVQGKDIDGDGKPDLILGISSSQGDSLAVYRNTSTGGRISFATKVNAGYVFYPTHSGFAINDLDGDGRPDVVIPTNDKFVKVVRNESSPGVVLFDKEYLVSAGRGTQQAIITDLDNDGKNDIAVTSFEESLISVIRNTSVPGALSFGATQNFAGIGPAGAIAAGDLDGDGLKDIIASSGSILLFQNTSVRGNISFASSVSLPGMSFEANFISILDFDNDGKSDIVICNSENIYILRNNSTTGNFSFSPPVSFGFGGNGSGGCVSNFSGSVKPDVVPAGTRNRQIILGKNISLPGNPKVDNMVFGPSSNSTPIFARSVEAADFDGDGKPDLVGSTLNDYLHVIVYKNKVNVPVFAAMCTTRQGNAIVSDYSGKTYQWQQDAGTGFTNVVNSANLFGGSTNTLQFENTPASWNGYKYRCLVDGGYSSTFVLRLNYTPSPGIMVTATDTTFCSGKTVTFSATDSTGYKNEYTWRWQINGKFTGYIGDKKLSTDTLKNLDQVRVILFYSDICGLQHTDTSNTITVHVNSYTASSVQISASNLSACAGTPVTFTATPVNPGSLPEYDWKVNNVSQGINNAIFTNSGLKKNDSVRVFMKSTATCAFPNPAPSNVLKMAVADTSALTVSISTVSTSVCKGANVLFTATPQNAGPVSSYQWTVNGITSGTNANTFNSSMLQDKDIVQCVLNSPSACRVKSQASSGEIIMTVKNPVIPSVSLSIRDTALCAGSTVIITALPVNPGAAPVYQWKENGLIAGTNSPTYTINELKKNTTVSVLMQSSACASPESISSAAVVITANPVPDIRISGDTVVVVVGVKSHLTASSYSGMNLQYQWQDSTRLHSWQDISGATLSTVDYAALKSGDKIRCIGKTPAGCMAVSNSIAIRINVPTATPGTPTVGTDYRWYPNPVSSTLNIQDENGLDLIATITVYSSLGIRVLVINNSGRQEKISINVSTLRSGAYFVETRRKSGKTKYFQFMKVQ